MRFYLTAALGVAVSLAPAQCNPTWAQGACVPGVAGEVHAALRWDPDGAGPVPEQLVVAGRFEVAGCVSAANIAIYDAATSAWAPLGSGVGGEVFALAVTPTGDLLVGGAFATAGGVATANIARWSSGAWYSVGGGVNGTVRAIATTPSGGWCVAGSFTVAAGSVFASRIAQWDGSSWSALGSGFDADCMALAVAPSGVLYAGGAFANAGGVAAIRVARWNGSAWQAVGVGMANHPSTIVRSLAVLTNGDVVAGGSLLIADPVFPTMTLSTARWNGVAWAAVSAGPFDVRTVVPLPNGGFVVGANSDFATWTTTGWTIVDTNGYVDACVIMPDGRYVVAGAFSWQMTPITTLAVSGIAFWNGTALASLNPGLMRSVYAIATTAGGTTILGGTFLMGNGNGVVTWNGSQWEPLGGGVSGSISTVFALAVLPDGDVVAGGLFTAAGGVPAQNTARWNGSQWSAMGSGPGGEVNALCSTRHHGLLAAGWLFAGSGYRVAQWNGTAWTTFGVPVANPVRALCELANGDIVVSTSTSTANANGILRWSGTAWVPLGTGVVGTANAMALDANGDLIAGGWIPAAGGVPMNHVARWNGTTWSALGAGVNQQVVTVATLPGDSLLVGGMFTHAGGQPANGLARWNGSSWSDVGAGFTSANITSLHAAATGEVWVGGLFHRAGGVPSANIARLSSSCGAASTLYGSGCSGAAGPVELASEELPWLGTEYRSVATGLPPGGFAVAVFSFNTTSVPLATLHPAGLPGCTLVVDDSILLDFPIVAGSAHSRIAIQPLPSLIGATFYHQMVSIETGPAGLIQAMAVSNGLQLTIGSW